MLFCFKALSVEDLPRMKMDIIAIYILNCKGPQFVVYGYIQAGAR